jgi:hypothetical protein
MRGAGVVLCGVMALAASACGRIVEPVAVVSCPSGECWDLSTGTDLSVNDEPTPADLRPNDAHAWRFHTIHGHRYLVLTRVLSGSADTYVAFSPIIDPYTHGMVDVRSGSGLSFTASGSLAYIAVADRGNLEGSAYTVRAVSYDEQLDPLPGTTWLTVNGWPAPRALVSGELARFVFTAVRGVDYTIHVTTTRGVTDAFASLIPSADDDFFDVSDPTGIIAFRASESSQYYIAVLDRSGALGSEVAVQVTSP